MDGTSGRGDLGSSVADSDLTHVRKLRNHHIAPKFEKEHQERWPGAAVQNSKPADQRRIFVFEPLDELRMARWGSRINPAFLEPSGSPVAKPEFTAFGPVPGCSCIRVVRATTLNRISSKVEQVFELQPHFPEVEELRDFPCNRVPPAGVDRILARAEQAVENPHDFLPNAGARDIFGEFEKVAEHCIGELYQHGRIPQFSALVDRIIGNELEDRPHFVIGFVHAARDHVAVIRKTFHPYVSGESGLGRDEACAHAHNALRQVFILAEQVGGSKGTALGKEAVLCQRLNLRHGCD